MRIVAQFVLMLIVLVGIMPFTSYASNGAHSLDKKRVVHRTEVVIAEKPLAEFVPQPQPLADFFFKKNPLDSPISLLQKQSDMFYDKIFKSLPSWLTVGTSSSAEDMFPNELFGEPRAVALFEINF